MAIIPLKQTVQVRKLVPPSDDEWNDDWDVEEYGEPTEYKVRATEKFEKVTNVLGEEITASVKLLFDKLPNIAYNDEVTYVNELGVVVRRKPLSIKPIRMVNGKSTLTAVYL